MREEERNTVVSYLIYKHLVYIYMSCAVSVQRLSGGSRAFFFSITTPTNTLYSMKNKPIYYFIFLVQDVCKTKYFTDVREGF